VTKPIVAIVGAPNVGKSTFFNRLVGEPMAIVEDLPGTTRDRIYGDAEWTGHEFIVVDTGGLIMEAGGEIETRVADQARIAIREADVVVFVVDASVGVTAGDRDVADLLRRSTKPLVLAANKADNEERRNLALEFHELALGTPISMSAIHGTGTGDVLDEVVRSFPVQPESEESDALKIAIVGRPNVGKSSLLNALLGEDRAIVSEVPGTTRDAIDTHLQWGDESVVLIDTAGIRRRGRIERGVEKYSVIRALRAISRADVVLLVLDAVDGVNAQDAHIAGYILEESKSVILVVNKWDLVEKDSFTMDKYTLSIQQHLQFLDYAPVIFVSAKTHQRVDHIIDLAFQAQEERLLRLSTSQLNRILESAVLKHSPPSKAGKQLKFYYATQIGVAPPTFLFFVNDAKLVHFSYERYLQNQLREKYHFTGSPLRLRFTNRGREGGKK
jgi:GTPase